jgi:cysteine-rich repeat protein
MTVFSKALSFVIPILLCVACKGEVGDDVVPGVCGDGIVQSDVEECDDANFIDNDGCSSLCSTSTKIVTEDINGFNPANSTFAFFTRNVITTDLDNDGGLFDDAISQFIVITSTRPDLCDIAVNDPFLETVSDTFGFILVVKQELNSVGDNFGAQDDLTGKGIAGDGLKVSAFFFVRDINSPNLDIFSGVSERKGNFRFVIQNGVLNGFAQDTIVGDFADTPDTDIDGDGTLDFHAISPTTIEIALVNAQECNSIFR